MASGRQQKKGYVWLNSRQYKLRDGTSVLRRIANEFAQKTVIGDFTEASDPVLSAFTWDNFTGGFGPRIAQSGQGVDLTQAYQAVQVVTEAPTHLFPTQWFGSASVNAIGFNSFTLYDSAGAKIDQPNMHNIATQTSSLNADNYHVLLAYNQTASALQVYRNQSALDSGWTFVDNIPSTSSGTQHNPSYIRKVRTGKINGLTYTVVPADTAIQWKTLTPTASFASDTFLKHIVGVAFWRDLLWALTDNGYLYFTDDPSTSAWVQVAEVPDRRFDQLTNIQVGELAIPGVDDREHLFISRTNGFDVYDRLSEKLVPGLRLPSREGAGRNLAFWNGAVYYPYGQSIFQWRPTDQGNIVTDVGLSGADGLTDEYNNVVISLGSTPRQLFAVTGRTQVAVSSAQPALFSRTARSGWSLHAAGWAPSALSASRHPELYVGQLWVNYASNGDSVEIPLVCPGWWSLTTAILHYPISVDLKLPSKSWQANDTVNQNIHFYTTPNYITPWYKADGNQIWTAHSMAIDATGYGDTAKASGTRLKLSYQTDLDENASAWKVAIDRTAIDSSDKPSDLWSYGRTSTPLPNSTEPVGVPFKSIRWKLEWNGDSTLKYHTGFFDVHRVELVFQKKPKLRYAFSFDIDYSEKVNGYTPKEQREALDEFFMQSTLGEFTYHDDTPGGGQTYYVTPMSPTAQEETGGEESGMMRMTVMQVVA